MLPVGSDQTEGHLHTLEGIVRRQEEERANRGVVGQRGKLASLKTGVGSSETGITKPHSLSLHTMSRNAMKAFNFVRSKIKLFARRIKSKELDA